MRLSPTPQVLESVYHHGQLVALVWLSRQANRVCSVIHHDLATSFYHNTCGICHGIGAKSSGTLPDSRMMSTETHDQYQAIIRGGLLQANGMSNFSDMMSMEDAERIHRYVISRANLDKESALAEQPSAGAEE